MNSIIIQPSAQNTLSPLLCNRDIFKLPIIGEPISVHIQRYLTSHGIDPSEIYEMSQNAAPTPDLSADDGIVAIEVNLITSTDLTDVIKAHLSTGADITAVIRDADDFGNRQLVLTDQTGAVTGISETDRITSPDAYNAEGIYIISPDAYKALSVTSDFCGTEIINQALKLNLKIMGYISDKSAVSVSSIENYKKCHMEILNGSIPVSMRAARVRDGFWVEHGADLESGVKIETPVYISSGCRIERGAKIGGGTMLGVGCTVHSDAHISHAVIGESCNIAERAEVKGGILSDNVSIGHDSVVMENAAIGSGCRVEGYCSIRNNVKIWPNKRISEGTRLSDNLVWGSVATEHLFRNGKICGEINIDITPEFMAKLGTAIGTLFCGAKIGLGFDSAPVCSMLASALSSGIMSSGASLFSFGEQSLPMTRCGVRYYNLAMGIHINQASSDGTFYPEIEFIESDGASFRSETEQNLESVFFNNVFLRSDTKRLKETVDLGGYRLSYVQDILNSLKSNHFSINMEARTRSETISEILELLLSETELHSTDSPSKEFSVDIDASGQGITLFDSEGDLIDNYRVFAISAFILLNHLDCRTVILPVSASSQLEEELKQNGASIIHCGTSDDELMHTLLKHNLFHQFRLCFDGVYFAITLLDYLNSNKTSFDSLLSSLPDCIHRESEIECPDSKKREIISLLRERYSDSRLDTTDGIKIFRNNGWVLVIPEKYRHYIRIITEGTDMEAAEEICNTFSNQIKKLAKPQ